MLSRIDEFLRVWSGVPTSRPRCPMTRNRTLTCLHAHQPSHDSNIIHRAHASPPTLPVCSPGIVRRLQTPTEPGRPFQLPQLVRRFPHSVCAGAWWGTTSATTVFPTRTVDERLYGDTEPHARGPPGFRLNRSLLCGGKRVSNCSSRYILVFQPPRDITFCLKKVLAHIAVFWRVWRRND